ncbi:hypothetical protein QO227_21340 [Vibrio vulnificus]|nr:MULTISPECIES: hypothetical protein [Vibrio]MCU8291203.1 hypothetical protein [Vibrio vulnificus]MCU8426437.1 hypothetical protein [Vibrio vulnificus]MDK2626898.1 hypothetical protein [Vibrio vulnificus]MDK2721584.1 hypothetical protein [Vibrio vulnificus]
MAFSVCVGFSGYGSVQ